MIIYGTGEKKLTISHLHSKSKCPHCNEFGITYHFFKQYFHLFWIPVLPIGSRQVAYCEKCHISYQESIPPSLTRDLEHAKSGTSMPLSLFSGSALFILGIAALVYFYDDKITYYYPSNKKQAEGRLVNNKEEGLWTYWYENGNLQAEHFYKDGVEDSIWTWYDENGTKTKVGGYRKGRYHGKWTFYYPTGQIEEEDMFVDNRKHGLSTYYYENGKKASEGIFERDREQGLWTFWYENGNKLSEGSYTKGLKKGIWKVYYEDGKISSEMNHTDSTSQFVSIWDEVGNQTVKDGNGIHITYYDDKQKSAEGKIKNGIYDGKWTYWHSNGTISEQGIFKDGIFTMINSWDASGNPMVKQGNGYHKTFYDNGIIAKECLYRNGKIQGLLLSRNLNGLIVGEENYEDGKLNGRAKYYQENGETQSEGEFKNNLQEGVWTWYHLNGKKEAEVTFVNGKKEGEEIFWSESEKIVKREFYKAGELIREEIYEE